LITSAESTTLSGDALYRLAFIRNLNGGALAPITTYVNAHKDARFNLPSDFQTGRSVNFGMRLVF
jgi:hypothetical protein